MPDAPALLTYLVVWLSSGDAQAGRYPDPGACATAMNARVEELLQRDPGASLHCVAAPSPPPIPSTRPRPRPVIPPGG